MTAAIVLSLGTVAAFTARSSIVKSKQAACMGNMRNIGTALHIYAGENNGVFPETSHTASLDRAWIFALESYLGDFEETRVCPADPKRAQRIEAGGTSYILNSFLFVPASDPFGNRIGPALNRPAAIPDPARTILAFVCSDSVGTGPGNDHTHSSLWSSWRAVCADIAPGRFGGSRQNDASGSSNYLFADGRVESIAAAEMKRRTQAGINIAKPPGLP